MFHYQNLAVGISIYGPDQKYKKEFPYMGHYSLATTRYLYMPTC